jgi:3-phenylpropionate/trans-cinnamate dioxygenase ferredoxin reductase subunit
MSNRRIVIVGSGVAGTSAAAQLRSSGFDGEVVLIGAEPELPYERPPLSKQFMLTGDTAEHPELHPAEFYERESIELMLGIPATELDLATRRVTLAGGRELRYDGLVLATGVRSRRLDGLAGERVHYLRNVSDALALRAALAGAERVAVVGGGLLGAELAAAATRLGKQVTLLCDAPRPLQQILGATVAEAMTDIHRAEGVEVRAMESVRSVAEAPEEVRLTTTGGTLACDLVVVACGSIPNLELAHTAGLAASGGVPVDERCRTPAPGVYAVGDIALQQHPRYGRALRVEHHDTAMRQGQYAARNLLGESAPFDEPHWFWSDQYDHSLQAVGVIADPGDVVIRGSAPDRCFAAITLRDGRIRSVIALNRPGDVLAARRLLHAEHYATEAQLRDLSLPLKRLAKSERRRSVAVAG